MLQSIMFKIGDILIHKTAPYDNIREVVEVTTVGYILKPPDLYKQRLSKEYVESEYRLLTKLEKALK